MKVRLALSSLGDKAGQPADSRPDGDRCAARGSNAIDGADPSGGCVDANPVSIPTDQHGMPRVFGARCDIDAYESGDGVFLNGFE
jgi:hypothetical protein